MIEKFIAATKASDKKTLLSLFTEDARMTSDGGKSASARRAIEGKRKIVHLFSMFGKKGRELFNVEIKRINGEIGTVTTAFGQVFSAAAYEFEGEKIRAVYQVMNPDKLKNL